MATAILTNDVRFTKAFSGTIEGRNWKKDFSMSKRRPSIYDQVSAKERLTTPFSYRWLKFKIKFFGLAAMTGSIR